MRTLLPILGCLQHSTRYRRTPASLSVLAPALASLAALAWAGAPLAADCASAGLLEKTQAFSDAGQRGDGAAMGALLDDRVVFFNEGGDRADKASMSSSTPQPGQGAGVKMTVTDWACELHGEVAVASFIDDQVITGPAPMHARYRSVETWLREAGAWKMIASQTLALPDDPPSVTLPRALLDDYVGAFRGPTGQVFTFARRGDELTAAVDGGPGTVQKAEVRDVFFTPGRSRFRKVFQRDAAGRVTGFAYRREGHDILFTRAPAAPAHAG